MPVSVFGSSRPQPGDPLYSEAERLGYLLAERGFTVMTGGYSGVMEAACKGARAAGGHTIGVTVTAFEEHGSRSGPNPYVAEIVRYPTLSERLMHLVTRMDAAVAVSGGVGTLAEIALTWNLIQSKELPPIPFVLLGEQWGPVLTQVYGDGAYIGAPYMDLWQEAATPEDAVELVENWTS